MSSDQTLGNFIANWTETDAANKKAFLEFKDHLSALEGVTLEFVAREGVTYSLRASHRNQKGQPLFVMVDVIEDQPRWLSICFYSEMVSDPDENGDFVPEGLLGEDALCFDVESYDETLQNYVHDRLDEAVANASGA